MMIGIFGASGLIGSELFRFLKARGESVLGTYCATQRDGLEKFDIATDPFSIFDDCTCVVIAGGISNIDECFRDKDHAFKINVEKTKELIEYLAGRHRKPIFLSSGQIFDGKKGFYKEEDEPNPLNCYGEYKLCVEEFMKEQLDDYLILRLSKIYSRDPDVASMFSEILNRLKRAEVASVPCNQKYNPTDVRFVSKGIHEAIEGNLVGLYHLAEGKVMSRYDFALQVAGEYGLDAGLVEKSCFRNLPGREKKAIDTSLDATKFYRKTGLTDEAAKSSA